MLDLNITDEKVFADWLEEEKVYLQGLRTEPQEETLQMEYWQKLVNLQGSECVVFTKKKSIIN
jgi:vacuolar-type H+-ATPase subunit E/Vma4